MQQLLSAARASLKHNLYSAEKLLKLASKHPDRTHSEVFSYKELFSLSTISQFFVLSLYSMYYVYESTGRKLSCFVGIFMCCRNGQASVSPWTYTSGGKASGKSQTAGEARCAEQRYIM